MPHSFSVSQQDQKAQEVGVVRGCKRSSVWGCCLIQVLQV